MAWLIHDVETGECHTLEDPSCAGLFPEAWLARGSRLTEPESPEQTGCPNLAKADGRRNCRAGARTMDDALVTFS